MKAASLAGAAFTLTLLVSLGVHGQQPDPNGERVGSETCLACHQIKKPFFASVHAAIECEDCHGAGTEHVEAGGDNLSVSFADKSPQWAIARCLSCHTRDSVLAAFMTSSHSKHDISCLGCHRVHQESSSSRLLREKQTDLCSSCHPVALSAFRKPFHHPVREGAMECSDCHQVHIENRDSLTRLASGTEEGCVDCHSDKAGPFVFEHGPLRIDNCQTCHQPHGSINAKLLRRAQVHLLCLECHAGNSATLGNTPPAFHDLRSPRYRNCTTCHRQIHGSNANPAFLR